MLIDDLTRHCLDRWGEWFGEPAPNDLNVAMVPSRAHSAERAVALVFARRRLRLVVKLTTGSDAGLSREQHMLELLAGLPELVDRVPRALGDNPRALTTGAAGHGSRTVRLLPMTPVGGRLWRPPQAWEPVSAREFSRVERVLRDLDDIMVPCHRAVPPRALSPLGIDWRGGAISLGIEDRHRRRLEDLQLAAPPAGDGCSHGDLAPGNLRVSGSQVRAILDWELCDTNYEPWFDRLYPALLAISSALLRGAPVPSNSWPARWLQVLGAESGASPIELRCLRATAELASRSAQLDRGSLDRWLLLADYFQRRAELTPRSS